MPLVFYITRYQITIEISTSIHAQDGKELQRSMCKIAVVFKL